MKRVNLTRLAIAAGLVIMFLEVDWVAGRISFGNPPLVILDPQIEYYLEPGNSYRRFGNNIEVNRYGMRSSDFERLPTEGERRV